MSNHTVMNAKINYELLCTLFIFYILGTQRLIKFNQSLLKISRVYTFPKALYKIES